MRVTDEQMRNAKDKQAQTENADADTAALLFQQWASERPDIDSRTVGLIANLYLLSQSIEAEFRTYCMREFGLGTGDMRILLALRRQASRGPMRVTDLCRSLLVSSGGVTKQVDRLERQGLVRRDPDPTQRKQRLISITGQGSAVADRAISVISTEFSLARALHTFSPSDADLFLAMIDRVRRA
jgi:DNA-binding MarR family transcriptional regulator